MLDEKDQKIIALLKENAHLSTYQLAKKTTIPQTTVLNRIRKLREQGLIKRYTIELDYNQLGKPLKALIFVKVDKVIEKNLHGKIGEIESRLAKNPSVLNVKRLMGRVDFVIEIIAKDIDELNQFLITKVRSLDEVAETETLVVLSEW